MNDGYQRLLTELWSEGEAFLLMEQDIEPNDTALHEAEECPCDWGISPYNGPGGDPLEGSLGFVRFNKGLVIDNPDLFSAVSLIDDGKDVPPGDWRRLDVRIQGVLRQREYMPHLHTPVLHHHVYGGTCACNTEHDVYPLDEQGRYRAPG